MSAVEPEPDAGEHQSRRDVHRRGDVRAGYAGGFGQVVAGETKPAALLLALGVIQK